LKTAVTLPLRLLSVWLVVASCTRDDLTIGPSQPGSGEQVAFSAIRHADPCATSSQSGAPPGPAHSLTPVEGGLLVYDATQGLCWLADADLAGDPGVRALVTLSATNADGSTPVINPDGTMDYETALNWVDALNRFEHGNGWLGHHNWQLPSNPSSDPTCSHNFGILCTGSALGNLYAVGLARTYPNTLVPGFVDFAFPFLNLHPGLYWTSTQGMDGQKTFSFNTGAHGENTIAYNFFHVLPVTTAVLGPVPTGSGVLPYLRGPGAGRAVYDTKTHLSWTLDANLPAWSNFGDTTTLTLDAGQGRMLNVSQVNRDGTVHFTGVDTASTTGWIVSLNNSGFAGTNTWRLPAMEDLDTLYAHLNLEAGDPRLEWPFPTGPFAHAQPGFYWACVRADNTGANGRCDLSQTAPGGLEWSFNFDDGFEGTDLISKQFYVMVYFPAP